MGAVVTVASAKPWEEMQTLSSEQLNTWRRRRLPYAVGGGRYDRGRDLLWDVTPFDEYLGSALLEWLQSPGSADLTFEIEIALASLLSAGVKVRRLAGVRDYLLRYPDMTELVLSICSAVSARFGGRVALSLEVYRDPEIPDEYLTLYVRQERYEDQLWGEIDDITAAYEEEFANRSGWLVVTTDFRLPD